MKEYAKLKFETLSKPPHTEHEHQRLLVRFLRALRPKPVFTFTCGGMGGGKSGCHIRYRSKQLGYENGVPDIIVFEIDDAKKHTGLAIEMKTPHQKRTRSTKEQERWLAHLNRIGYKALYGKGWEHAVQTVIVYLFGSLA